jgi:hypothetical protein
MEKRQIPRHEPEVIEAEARKNWRGNTEKVATTSLKSLDVHGVTISSRYEKADEMEAMVNMVDGVDPLHRRYIESIWCDSKAGFCYSVTLADCPEQIGFAIAHQLDMTCRERNEGHNGISIEWNRGIDIDRDPWWPGQDDDEDDGA